ncbi:UpxY family transcription antiterminator [candidate division KSB1 bacterium]|nr:UpxY family transcription antiterminator [candidate division KSB1 bacterium]
MEPLQRRPLWYAFVTRPRHEKKVQTYLEQIAIEHYLPLRRTLNQWKDRKRWVDSPLFSCYIFARIAYIERYRVLEVPSVARIVGFNNQPTPIPDADIEAIRLILTTKQEIAVVDGFLHGQLVEIKSGPLHGMRGRVVDFRGSRWVEIHIEAISKAVLVDVQENVIRTIDT